MPHLECQVSRESYPISTPMWKSKAGQLLDIQASEELDWDLVKSRSPGLWRYREALALAPELEAISFGEGFTPLREMKIGNRQAKIKLDYLFPSGSYKDRGSTVMLSQIKHLGISSVVQDSSGNAGASVAQYAALANIACQIFLPENTSPAKISQMEFCGAEIVRIPGSREDTAQAALKAAEETFYASHVWNPFFFQGTKTFAYEMYEQLGDKAPDTLVLPAGNGTLLIGAYLGFSDLKNWGLIPRIPRLIGIQAAHCAPLWQASQAKSLPESIPSIQTQPTLAEGIAIAEPRRGGQMMQYVQDSGGHFRVVEEAEILEAWQYLGKQGYFVEPTSAAVFAGLVQYLNQASEKEEIIASVLTGHGLKSSEKIKGIHLD